MSENYYERDLLNRLDAINAHAQANQTTQALATTTADAERRNREHEASHAEELGRMAANILLQNNIQKLPILILDDATRKLREGGKGWHVVTFQEFEGTEALTTARHMGLTANGKLLNFTSTRSASYARRNAEWRGIIMPEVLANGARKVQLLESDAFKNGLASLIAGHGPYNDPRTVSF